MTKYVWLLISFVAYFAFLIFNTDVVIQYSERHIFDITIFNVIIFTAIYLLWILGWYCVGKTKLKGYKLLIVTLLYGFVFIYLYYYTLDLVVFSENFNSYENELNANKYYLRDLLGKLSVGVLWMILYLTFIFHAYDEKNKIIRVFSYVVGYIALAIAFVMTYK